MTASKRSGAIAAPVDFRRRRPLSGIVWQWSSRRSFRTLLEADDDVREWQDLGRTSALSAELAGDPRIDISSVETTDADWFDLGVVVTIDGRSIRSGRVHGALAGPQEGPAERRGVLLAVASLASAPARSHRRGGRARGMGDRARASAGIRRLCGRAFEDLADEAAARRSRGVPRARHRATPTGSSARRSTAALRADLRPYQRVGYGWLVFL